MNYTIYSEIPKIPEHLLTTDIDEIRNKYPNNFPIETEVYTLHPITDELYVFLKDLFPDHENISYQIIKEGIPIHKDHGRVGAINYLIHTGGDNVSTAWYDDDGNLLDSTVFPERTWHYVKADIDHGIHDLTDVRVAITISVKK